MSDNSLVCAPYISKHSKISFQTEYHGRLNWYNKFLDVFASAFGSLTCIFVHLTLAPTYKISLIHVNN